MTFDQLVALLRAVGGGAEIAALITAAIALYKLSRANTRAEATDRRVQAIGSHYERDDQSESNDRLQPDDQLVPADQWKGPT